MPTVIDSPGSPENAAARAMIRAVVAVMNPVAERVIDGEFRLLPGQDVTLDEVRTAVFMATGIYLREIAVLNRAAYDALGARQAFSRTLEQGIESLHGFRLLTTLGSRRWQQHRRHFGYDAVVPLEARLATATERLPRQNLRAALFHFWGYALAMRHDAIERFMPLVGLLPKAIPLGELKGRPGTWAVLVA